MTTLFLSTENGSIAYDLSGSGPLVIGVPGMGDLRAEYRFLAPQLVSAGYRVAAMDIRGHGESGAQWDEITPEAVGRDILALIRALDSGPDVIIGNSFAAGSAVWAAAEAPALISGIVLIGPSIGGQITGLSRLFYSLLFSRPWGSLLWTKYYNTLYPTRKPADLETYSATLLANLKEKGRLESLRRLLFASQVPARERLPHVKAPALILIGNRDPDFKDPAAHARNLAGQLPAAYHIIEGAGHYPHVEMPAETTPHILNFLHEVSHAA